MNWFGIDSKKKLLSLSIMLKGGGEVSLHEIPKEESPFESSDRFALVTNLRSHKGPITYLEKAELVNLWKCLGAFLSKEEKEA